MNVFWLNLTLKTYFILHFCTVLGLGLIIQTSSHSPCSKKYLALCILWQKARCKYDYYYCYYYSTRYMLQYNNSTTYNLRWEARGYTMFKL